MRTRFWGDDIDMERNNHGFSLAEIIIGLFIVTMITVLIGALGQQAAQFSNKTKQIGTVLELRTKIAAVSKDPENFLKEMQDVHLPGSSLRYNACLQNATNTLSSFTCPAVKPALLNPSSALYDAEVAKHADGVFKVTDTELVDTRGQKIAGTINDPFYLSADGFECSAIPKNKKCPLMSTGYFFRTNDATNQDPGSLKFLVKVASNPESALGNSGTTPMKAQYMSIDLGSQWASVGSPCPGSSIQVGVDTNGSPMCLVPINCGPSSLLVGVKPDASPNCKSIPACPTNKRIVLNEVGDLECVGNSPCPIGQAHLGYYSGTSDPICSSPTSCSAGQVLLGSTCESIDTCVGTERLTFANNTFSCQAVTTVSGEQCTKAGEFLVGFDAQGKAQCEAGIAGKDGEKGEAGERGISGEKGEAGKGLNASPCAVGSFVRGVNPNGTFICSTAISGTKQTCDAGEVMKGIKSNGEIICASSGIPVCTAGQGLVKKDSGDGYRCKDLCNPVVPDKPWIKTTLYCRLKSASGPYPKDHVIRMELGHVSEQFGVSYGNASYGEKQGLGLLYDYKTGVYKSGNGNEHFESGRSNCTVTGASLKDLSETALNKDGC